MQNMTITTEMKDSELTMLQAELQERAAALTEAEQTLASYGEMETEWRTLSEGLEEKVRERDELLTHRDQEVAEHVTQKDQLVAQLQEKGEYMYACIWCAWREKKISKDYGLTLCCCQVFGMFVYYCIILHMLYT